MDGATNISETHKHSADVCNVVTAEVSKRRIDASGFLHVPGIIGRAGIYQYRRGELGLDGDPMEVVNLYRPADVVEQSLTGLTTLILTDGHPDKSVSLANVRDTWAGVGTGFGFADGNIVANDLMWTDQAAIDKIMSNARTELSTGETIHFDITNGALADGQQYQAVLTGVTYNHLALVDVGRAGSAAVANEDSMDDNQPIEPVAEPVEPVTEPAAEPTVEPATEAPAEVEAIGTLKSRIADLEAQLEAIKAANVVETNNAAAAMDKYFDAVDAAKRVIPGFDRRGKSLSDVHRAVIAYAKNGLDVADKSPEYVEGVFDGIVSNWRPAAAVSNTAEPPKSTIYADLAAYNRRIKQ